MLDNPQRLIERFRVRHGTLASNEIVHRVRDCSSGLHRAGLLLPLHGAVYVFSLTATHGARCEAGPGRALKVGMAGPNSNARFASQHYDRKRANSTLAGRLVDWTERWDELGIETLDDETAGDWIRSRTDRDHFFIPAAHRHDLLPALERFLHLELRPIFEGPRPGLWE